jgi:branched-chain amino acid transport system permease protein
LPAALVPVLRNTGVINDYYYQVLMMIGINSILSIGLGLVNGFSGQFSLGHAGFMGIGAYVAAVLTSKAAALPFLLATLMGGIASAVVGYAVGIPAFRVRGDYLAVITLALNMIVVNVAQNINYIGGPRGFPGIIPYSNFTWIWLWVVLCVLVIRNLIVSGHGRAIMSVRENEVAAQLGGIDVQRYKLLAFSAACFFAGVAGSLSAHMLQFIAPQNYNIFRTFDILVMVYLGGAGSISGCLLGAMIWTALLEALRDLGVWRLVLGPILLIILMIFRQKGIFGGREFSFIRGDQV